MKKTTLAFAALTVLAAQAFSASAFAQSATGPATGEGNGKPAAAPTSKPTKAERKAAGVERRATMKKSNKAGEIPSPSVAPKSY